MTIGVYVRVSTAEQNLASQKREITKWLTGNGIQPQSALWYIDKESGETLNRPELEQLQRDIFNGAIKTVVVYKLDRLSRSVRDGIDILCQWCEKGVRVVSVSQQIDFNGAVGKMIAAVLFAVAQMETETRRERQAAGIAAAKENGVYTGRKKGAVKAGVDPAKAVKLYEKGLTQQDVAKAMGVSVSTVIRYLRAAE